LNVRSWAIVAQCKIFHLSNNPQIGEYEFDLVVEWVVFSARRNIAMLVNTLAYATSLTGNPTLCKSLEPSQSRILQMASIGASSYAR
jgi:hypothetical protein